MRYLALLLSLWSIAALAQIDVKTSDLPTQSYGAFYRPAGDKLEVRLGDVKPMRAQTRHLLRCLLPVFTPSSYYLYDYPHAPDQLQDRRPTFRITLPRLYQPSDVHIVRLVQSANHRELAISSGNTAFTYGLGVSSKSAIHLRVEDADGALYVTPENTLEPGEYLIAVGPLASVAWDFGIGPEHD